MRWFLRCVDVDVYHKSVMETHFVLFASETLWHANQVAQAHPDTSYHTIPLGVTVLPGLLVCSIYLGSWNLELEVSSHLPSLLPLLTNT